MSDELREKVAWAIAAECRCAMGCRGAIDHYTEADAAIALIWNEAMEEAVKVADKNAAEAWNDKAADDTRGLMRLQADDIAAAIRARKEP